MSNFSLNLRNKLQLAGITTISEIKNTGYLNVFARIKSIQPSISFNLLYELFCLIENCSFSTLTPDVKKNLVFQYKNLPKMHKALTPEIINTYLDFALEQANLAYKQHEIPIGAVIVQNNQIIGKGFNQTRTLNDILAHAEIQAIRQAQTTLKNFRLTDCDLFVTIEPCIMCSGAIINSRIRRLIFGAQEPKTGACISQYSLFNNRQVNHHCEIIGPVNPDKYGNIVSNFFVS